MDEMANPTAVYWATSDAMIAEVSAFDHSGILPATERRYLVMMTGDAQWDTEAFSTREVAKEQAHKLAKMFGIPCYYVG